MDLEDFKAELNRFLNEPEEYDELLEDAPELKAFMDMGRKTIKYKMAMAKEMRAMPDKKAVSSYLDSLLNQMEAWSVEHNSRSHVLLFMLAESIQVRLFKHSEQVRKLISHNGWQVCEAARESGKLLSKHKNRVIALDTYRIIQKHYSDEEIFG